MINKIDKTPLNVFTQKQQKTKQKTKMAERRASMKEQRDSMAAGCGECDAGSFAKTSTKTKTRTTAIGKTFVGDRY